MHIVGGNADLRSGSACQLEGLAFGAGCEFHVDAYPVRLYGRTRLTLPDTESPSSRRAVSPGRRTSVSSRLGRPILYGGQRADHTFLRDVKHLDGKA